MSWKEYVSAKWAKYSGPTGWAFGILAVAVGIFHIWEIRDTASQLRHVQDSLTKDLGKVTGSLSQLGKVQTSLSNDLQKVRSSVSTQYVGEFPDFLDEIIKTISVAQREITMVTDFPAYAAFSDARRSLLIRQTVEQKLQAGIKVHLICLDAKHRFTATRMQFAQEDFAVQMANPGTQEAYLNFSRAVIPKGSSLTYDLLMKAMEDSNVGALKQTYRDAEVLQVAADIPVFFWISDKRLGVMAVQTAGSKTEYGFRTSDSALISALLATCDRYPRR